MRREGGWVYRMREEARIEVVLLGRERELVLRLAADSPLGGRIAVSAARAGEKSLGSVTIADPLRIPLPADLEAGRATLRLKLESGEAPVVQAGALRPIARPGGGDLDGDGLRLRGTVRSEVYFPCAGSCTLSGEVSFAGASSPAAARVELGPHRHDAHTALVW